MDFNQWQQPNPWNNSSWTDGKWQGRSAHQSEHAEPASSHHWSTAAEWRAPGVWKDLTTRLDKSLSQLEPSQAPERSSSSRTILNRSTGQRESTTDTTASQPRADVMAMPVGAPMFMGTPDDSPATHPGSDPEPEEPPADSSAPLPHDEVMPDADHGAAPDEDVKMEPAAPKEEQSP